MWILVGIFLGVFGVILLYLLVLLVASLWVKPGKEYEKYSSFYGWLVVSAAAIALFLGRVRVKVSGLEKIPKKGRFLFVCNHLSNYDPVVVWRYLPGSRVAFLCKKEVFSIPVLGKLIQKCCFRVMDRENVRNALTAIGKSAELLERGEVSIGVYPATFLDQFRKEHKNVLLFDCGDISQGTPYYNMFRGEVEVKLMNEMGYDAMTIGNHEFDFDLDNMALLFKMAKFPVVCSNYNLDATVLKDLVKPYVILKRFGLKIGVFGLGAKPEGLIQANKCVGVVYEDPIEVSNKVAALLKEKGCDLVVCLSHLGIQMDRELVAKTRNIDVILGGHSHTFMKGPENYQNVDGKEVPVMHTGKSGVRVGRLNLTLKRK